MAATNNKAIAIVTAEQARRLLLHAQGLLDDPTRLAIPATLAKLIEQMGFVQIDTINVVERAHHLTLLSRLDHYRPPLLAKLLEEKRNLFEHWTHDASAIPTQWFVHWKPRFKRYRHSIRNNEWWKQRIGTNPDKLLKLVKQRIVKDGPLLSRDFEHDRKSAPAAEEGWWGWKPQKAALEYLWRSGELAVVKRVNFQKVYDLTERIFPQQHAMAEPNLHEHIDWMCRSALARLGIATAAEIKAFWHGIELSQARQWCDEASRKGEIERVMVQAADCSPPREAFAFVGWQARIERLPALAHFNNRLRLLSPFDPVLRDRKRTQRLFNFDYSFEAFVPAPKRRYGYFVLPILEADRLVGRLDPKFHREQSTLQIKGVWWEPNVKPSKARKAALDEAVRHLAMYLGAEQVQMPQSH